MHSHRKSFEVWTLLLTLFLSYVVLYPTCFFGSGTFFWKDFGLYEYPAAVYAKHALLSGYLPEWCPQSMLGVPFLAQYTTMVFYPPTVLYLVLPTVLGVNWFMLLHLLLLGVGVRYLLLEYACSEYVAWILGYAGAFSGLTLSALIWPHIVATLAWLPWVLASVLRLYRRPAYPAFLQAVFVVVMQLLTGMPEWILGTWVLGLGLLFLEPRRVGVRYGLVGLVVLAASGVAAVQLFPFLDLLFHSVRVEGAAWGIVTHPADYLTWHGLIGFLVPFFDATRSSTGFGSSLSQRWIAFYYPSLFVSVGALVALVRPFDRRWAWGLFGVVLLALFGASRWCPLPLMYFPIAWIIVPYFAVFLLAAPLVQSVSVRVSFLFLAVALFLCFWQHGVWMRLVSEFAFAGVILLALRRQWSRWLVVLLIFADVVCALPRLNPVVSSRVWHSSVVGATVPPLGHGRFVQSRSLFHLSSLHCKPAQVIPLSVQMMSSDLNLLPGASSLSGFWALQLAGPTYLEYYLSGPGHTRARDASLLDFLDVVYAPCPTNVIFWRRRATALPEVTIGERPVVMSHANSLLANYRGLVGLSAPLPSGYGPDATAKVVDFHVFPQRVTAAVRASRPCYVVVSQAYYHWWRAWVNGRPAPVLRADGFAQAIPVPAGSSQVVLRYCDTSLWCGLVLTVFTLCLLVLGWFVFPRAPRRFERLRLTR